VNYIEYFIFIRFFHIETIWHTCSNIQIALFKISWLVLILYLFLSEGVLGTKWETLSKQVIWLTIWLEDSDQEWLKSTEILNIFLTTFHQLWVEETNIYYYQYADTHDEGSYRPPGMMVCEMCFPF
jgi:hypothetical protein